MVHAWSSGLVLAAAAPQPSQQTCSFPAVQLPERSLESSLIASEASVRGGVVNLACLLAAIFVSSAIREVLRKRCHVLNCKDCFS